MRQTNICFLVRDGKVLLGMKKRGFGAGKWNGFGGKLAPGEDVLAATVREVKEEAGIDVLAGDLRDAGELTFRFHENPDWDNFCRIFVAEEWSGEPSESEEMRPEWYLIEELPFGSMWVDDPHWVPLVLAGKKIRAEFLFSPEGDVLQSVTVAEVPA